jgi:replicative DNA helicase
MKDLPHDLDGERDFLGCAFRDFRIVAQYAALEPPNFFSEKHRIIWQAFQNLHRDGKASLEEDYSILPYFVVAEAKKLGGFGSFFPDGGEYIFEVFENAPSLSNADCFAERISNASALRKTISLLQKNIAEACEPGADANAVASGCIEAVSGIAVRAAKTRDEHIADIAKQELDGIEERMRLGSPAGAPTGFSGLDGLTGGLRSGELVILGARTGMGKTSLAMDIAIEAAKTMPVKFFSLEMARKQIAPRALSFFSQVNLKRTINATLSEAELLNQRAVIDELRKLNLYMEFEAGMKMQDICLSIHDFAARRGKGLIVIDHLHYLRTDEKNYENRNIEIGKITHALKEIAKKLDIPILLLSQLNRALDRAVKDKKPKLSDLRDSGNIEQDADMVWFVHRDGYYDPNVPASETDIIVAKNRSGPTGETKLHFDTCTTRFHDAPPAIGRDGYEKCGGRD